MNDHGPCYNVCDGRLRDIAPAGELSLKCDVCGWEPVVTETGYIGHDGSAGFDPHDNYAIHQ